MLFVVLMLCCGLAARGEININGSGSFNEGNLKYSYVRDNNGNRAWVTGLADGVNPTEISIPANVSKSGYGYNVTSISSSAFKGNKTLTAVSINVPTVNASAFANCTGLQTITIGNAYNTIDATAFSGCTNVTKIDWKSNRTLTKSFFSPFKSSLQTVYAAGDIEAGAFEGFTKLKKVDGYSGCITFIGSNAFKGCTALTSISVANVTQLGTYVFSGCTSLTSLASMSMNEITNIPEGTFENCESLENSIWGINLFRKATSIGKRAFYGCKKIREFNMDWYELEDYGLYDLAVVKSIGESAFEGCSALTEIRVPKELESLGARAFAGCSSAEGENVYRTAITEYPAYLFEGCTKISEVIMTPTITKWGEGVWSGTGVKTINWNDGRNYKLTAIPANCFNGCTELTKVEVPAFIKQIGAQAFMNCTKLASVTMDASSTQEWGDAVFNGCTALSDVTMPRIKTIPNYAFKNCSALESITLPYYVNTIQKAAFQGCTRLADVYALDNTLISISTGTEPSFSTSDLSAAQRRLHINFAHRGNYSSQSWNTYFTFAFVQPESLSLDQTTLTLHRTQTYKLSLLPVPANGDASAHWTSSDESVATVDATSGRVAAMGTGECDITATSDLTGEQFTCHVTVDDLTAFEVNQPEATLFRPATLQLQAVNPQPEGTVLEVTWTSDNPEVATVSESGKVTAVGKGQATITATNVNGVTATSLITVKDVESITWTEKKSTLMMPETFTFGVSCLPEGTEQKVTWQTSNPAVLEITATTDNTVTVRTVAAGRAVVTATSVNGVSSTFSVDVMAQVVRLDKSSLLLKPGTSQTLTATIEGGVTWSSNKTSVATVDASGKVTAVAEGTAVIKAQSKTYDYASTECVVTVSTIDNYMYVGNIYYLPIEGAEGEVQVTNMGFGQPQYYTSGDDRTEYAATVNIPAQITYNGKTFAVTQVGDYAFYRMKDLQSVIVPVSVKSVGTHAFEHSENLRSVSFTSPSTSLLKRIGYSAFEHCTGITSITIPDGVTSIEPAAFKDCSSLKTIKLPAVLPSLSAMLFMGCEKLDNFTIPAAVHTIGESALRDCKTLANITYNTRLTMIDEWAFAGCTSLAAVTLPAGFTTLQRHAYDGCTALASFAFPASLQGVGEYAFNGCEALASLAFAHTAPITVGNNAFEGCEALNTVSVESLAAWVETHFGNAHANPTTYAHSLAQNGTALTALSLPSATRFVNQYALSGLKGLTTVTIPASVKTISDNVFEGCNALTSIVLQGAVPPLYVGTRSAESARDLVERVALSVPEAAAAEAATADFWQYFLGIELPEAETAIDLNHHYAALKPGESLQLTDLAAAGDLSWSSNLAGICSVSSEGKLTAVAEGTAVITARLKDNAEVKAECVVSVSALGVMYVGGVFYMKESEDKVSVTNLGQSFPIAYGNQDRYEYEGILPLLSSITYQGTTYTVDALAPYAFYRMADLQQVIVPAAVETVGTMAFEQSKHLQRVQFAAGSLLRDLGMRAFYQCETLDEVVLPDGVFTIPESAFSECENLKSITLPKALTNINEYAFRSCVALRHIALPATLSAMQDRAFADCSVLESITIPEATIGIGAYAFAGCSQMSEITFLNEGVMTVNDYAFADCNALKCVNVEHLDQWAMTNFGVAQSNPLYYAKAIAHGGEELTTINLPATTYYVNQYAFVNCEAVREILLPADVATVSDDIFTGCSALERVVCQASSVPVFIGTRPLSDMLPVFEKATLFVPAGSKDEYAADDYWGRYHVISAIVKGDADGSGDLTTDDSTIICDYILGLAPDGFEAANVDVNGDGRITIGDLVRIIDMLK